jgi:hypothetical protein
VTTYSYAQLEQLWINAGGAPSLAPVAAAIAEAESGGRSDANNYSDSNGQGGTQTSWGLWQISDGTHNMPVANIDDPAVNAQAAVAKYKASGGWSPWGTYTSGAYKAFLSGSTTPDPNVPAGSATASTTALTSGPCVISLPVAGCLLNPGQARGLIGGMLIAAGGLLVLPGLIVLAAAGFAAAPTGGASAAVSATEKVPGYGTAIRAARTASRARTARREGGEQQRVSSARAAGAAAQRKQAAAKKTGKKPASKTAPAASKAPPATAPAKTAGP